MKIDLTCPVELWHYALPTPQYPFCRLQLFNLTEQTVASVQASFACYDGEGLLISRQVERVQRLEGKGRSAFEMAVEIENGVQAAGMDFSVEKVWFEDGTVWRHTAGNVSQYTPNVLPAGRRLEVLRYLAGQDALGYPMDQGAVWLCVCGRPNAAGEDTCRRCGRLKRDVFTGFNEATVEKIIFEHENAMEEMARQERAQARQQAESDEKARQKKRRRRRRFTAVILGTLTAAILGFGVYFHGISAYRFFAAGKQLENGVYSAAKAEYDTLAAQRGKRSLPVKIDAIGLDIDLLDMQLYYKSAELSRECTYRQACETLGTGTVPALRTAQDAFDGLGDYKDSQTMALEARYRRARLLMSSRQYESVVSLCDEMTGYKDSATLRSGAEYQLATQLMEAGNYQAAREKFLALGSFEDAANNARLCLYQPAVAAIDRGEYRQAIELLTQLEPGFEATGFKLQEAYYGLAGTLYGEQNYDAAAEYYLLAGDYRDAYSQATACLYEPAVLLMEQGEYVQARDMFNKIQSYRDSLEKSWQCSEALGRAAMENGDYEQARGHLEQAAEYEPAQELMKESYYLPAVSLQESGDNEGALALLEKIPGYKDADERAVQLRYNIACALLDAEDYAAAVEAFSALADYEDSAERLDGARRSLAAKLLETGAYEEAVAQLDALKEPEAAAGDISRIHYEWAKKLLAEENTLEAGKHFGLAGDYEDAREQYEKCMYALAEAAIARDDYEMAAEYLTDIPEYADAADLRQRSIYHTAELHEEAGRINEAAALFASISGFGDAEERAKADYDAYYGEVYGKAKELMAARDYAAAIEAMETVERENESKAYGDLERMYKEANYLYANQLYDEKKPYEALTYYRRILDYKDVERKLDRVCYRMLGRWVSRTGIEMEFREDGTCTIDGKAYYFRGSQFAFFLGNSPDALKEEWTIYDCDESVLSVENNKAKVQYSMTRVTE